jgi:hypothetical protein
MADGTRRLSDRDRTVIIKRGDHDRDVDQRGVRMSRAFVKETDDTFADVPEPAGSCRRAFGANGVSAALISRLP